MKNPCFVFAYGSNLDVDQMKARCPSTELVDVATLPRVRLVFAGFSPRWGNGGVAGIELAPRRDRGKLHGVVYRVTPNDLARLDVFEGHPTGYERVAAHPTLGSGFTLAADVYMLRRGLTTPRPPHASYLERIEKGYRANGLPLSALRGAFERCIRERGLAPMTDPAYEGGEAPCRSLVWEH